MRHWLGFLVIASFLAYGAAGVLKAPLEQTVSGAWLGVWFSAFVLRGIYRLMSGSTNSIFRYNGTRRA